MRWTIHHATSGVVSKWIDNCSIEGEESGVRYSIQRVSGVSTKLALVDQQDRQVALMKLEGFLPGSIKMVISNAQGNCIGHVKANFLGHVGRVKDAYVGLEGEAFQYKADVANNIFSLTSGHGGVSIRPENRLQLDTKRLEVDATHPDHFLMLCFAVLWLQYQISTSTVRSQVSISRRNIPWAQATTTTHWATYLGVAMFVLFMLLVLWGIIFEGGLAR